MTEDERKILRDATEATLRSFPDSTAKQLTIKALDALDKAEAELRAAREALEAERAGAETLDEEGMDANEKLSKLAALIIDLRVGTPYGQKAKAYARFCLGQGDDPTREVLPHEQEGSESYALALPPPAGTAAG